jgi:hypothetical protein
MAVHYPKIGYIPEPIAVYNRDRPGSLIDVMKTIDRQKVMFDMLERTIKLAEQNGRMDNFRPCALFYLRKRIRSSLFQYEMASFVRDTLRRFNSLLPVYYKAVIMLLTKFPRTTATILHMVSKIIRRFNLRRQISRRPRR